MCSITPNKRRTRTRIEHERLMNQVESDSTWFHLLSFFSFTNRRRNPRFITFDKNGFTLIELLVVVAIMSVMAIAIVPRVSDAFGGGKGSLNEFTSLIARAYDNAFLRGEECYLAIHCENPPFKTPGQSVLSRENGASVLVYDKDGELTDSKSRMLKTLSFPGSFHINEVILSTGQVVQAGTALIPFNPEGYSDDAIVHVTAGEERFSVIIYKLKKEPRVVPEHVSFEDVRSGNVL